MVLFTVTSSTHLKLQFKQNKVSFYGHTPTEDGLLPAEDKLRAIKDIQAPTNTKELQTLLGMVTYHIRLSTKLAELVAPLRELNEKNVHFRWEPHHQQALDDIKKELLTILQYDASTLGLGAWIRQIDQHGQEKIVGVASRCLSPTESRYSNIERECLAVMFGLEKFEYYLLGRQVMQQRQPEPPNATRQQAGDNRPPGRPNPPPRPGPAGPPRDPQSQRAGRHGVKRAAPQPNQENSPPAAPEEPNAGPHPRRAPTAPDEHPITTQEFRTSPRPNPRYESGPPKGDPLRTPGSHPPGPRLVQGGARQGPATPTPEGSTPGKKGGPQGVL
uniref:Reverse transcriptase/retrotransposon-derived protein RNase H-like domain-containing protein n=1 Tax=Oryzias latipes TaxID=8090 RepID=A0A3B3HY19_ORYLA